MSRLVYTLSDEIVLTAAGEEENGYLPITFVRWGDHGKGYVKLSDVPDTVKIDYNYPVGVLTDKVELKTEPSDDAGTIEEFRSGIVLQTAGKAMDGYLPVSLDDDENTIEGYIPEDSLQAELFSADSTKVYLEPSDSSRLVYTLAGGVPMKILGGEENGCIRISFTRWGTTGEGYITMNALRRAAIATHPFRSSGAGLQAENEMYAIGTVTVHVRPEISAGVMYTIYDGQKVTVRETEGSWCAIDFIRAGYRGSGYVKSDEIQAGVKPEAE